MVGSGVGDSSGSGSTTRHGALDGSTDGELPGGPRRAVEGAPVPLGALPTGQASWTQASEDRLSATYVDPRRGGTCRRLPRGFHAAVQSFLDDSRRSSTSTRPADQERDYLKRTQGVGVISHDDAVAYALVGPIARAAGVDYDVRKDFPISATRPTISPCRPDRGRRLRPLPGARRRDAREHEDLPPGARSESRRTDRTRSPIRGSRRRRRTASTPRWKR